MSISKSLMLAIGMLLLCALLFKQIGMAYENYADHTSLNNVVQLDADDDQDVSEPVILSKFRHQFVFLNSFSPPDRNHDYKQPVLSTFLRPPVV